MKLTLGIAVGVFLGIMAAVACHAQTTATPSTGRTASPTAKRTPALTMTKQFRKTSRLAVDALFVALNDNYTEGKRDDAKVRAETLIGQAEIERESAGDKAAHAALKRLQFLVRHSRAEETGYKGGLGLGFSEIDWQDAERQAKDCASALGNL